jgi:hypothetical protein
MYTHSKLSDYCCEFQKIAKITATANLKNYFFQLILAFCYYECTRHDGEFEAGDSPKQRHVIEM